MSEQTGFDYFGSEQFQSPEDRERDKLVCAGCHKPKTVGLVVCWPCFKQGKHPFKYWQRCAMEYQKIDEETAVERMRARKAVYAAFHGDDPGNGVIRLKYLAEVSEFQDVLYVRV